MVECAALEMRCAGNGTVGSNPTLSATVCLNLYAGKNPVLGSRTVPSQIVAVARHPVDDIADGFLDFVELR